MSALAIRTHVQRLNHHYLCPLAQTGKTAEKVEEWIEVANSGTQPLQPIYVENEKGERKLLAEGCEIERTVRAEIMVAKPNGEEETKPTEWQERVFIVRSESYRKAQQEALQDRLRRATDRLLALTPAPGRGKRQIQDEADLLKAVDAILKAYAVEGLLSYTFERQEKRRTRYIGRGRGGSQRPTEESVSVRYQITSVIPQPEAIAAYQKTLGWRIYVTNAPSDQLSLEQAVLTYRDEWIIERGFHRLKGTPLSLDPLFLKRDDQVAGLTNLLTIAVRFLTLIEFVVRRNLRRNQEKLTGLIENNPKKGIDNPTTERLLKQFNEITLTIVHLPNQTIRHVTPLTGLQIRILELLGLSPSIYTRLAEN